MLNVNLTAIFLATTIGFFLGGLWFKSFAFGKKWQSFLTTTKVDRQKGAKKALVMTYVLYLLMSFLLAEGMKVIHQQGMAAGALLGLLIGVGFVASNAWVMSLFRAEPMPLFLIEYGCQTATLTVMGAVVGAWI